MCPITSFELYIDDGNSGPFAAVDVAQIANKDYIRQHTVVFAIADAGKQFRFKLRAYNEIGYAESTNAKQILASVPGAPSAGPVSDPKVTGVNKIKVDWTVPNDDGGSEIISYALEIDNGSGGDLNPLIGVDSNYLLLHYTIDENIVRATQYRLRYHAKNAIGWGPYSEIVYILAANVPARPPAPEFVSSVSTSMILNLF
jgi:hypothetical protein